MSLALLDRTEPETWLLGPSLRSVAVRSQPPEPGWVTTESASSVPGTFPFGAFSFPADAVPQEPHIYLTGFSTTSLTTSATAFTVDGSSTVLLLRGEEESPGFSDEVRLHAPTRRERELRVRIMFLGREPARVTFEPDADW